MAPRLKIENCTVETVTIHNGPEPGASGVTINVSGGSCTFAIYEQGPVPPQQEVVGKQPDDSPIEQLEEQPAKSREVVRSCQKRLSELRRRICTWDDSTRPGLEFWQELYGLCGDLERDLDKALK